MILGADSGKVMITKHDVVNRVIEGTFYFNGSEFIGTETVKVTEGTFAGGY